MQKDIKPLRGRIIQMPDLNREESDPFLNQFQEWQAIDQILERHWESESMKSGTLCLKKYIFSEL